MAQQVTATWLFTASKVSLASPCVALTLPYHVPPPLDDYAAAAVSSAPTVWHVVPPKALLVSS